MQMMDETLRTQWCPTTHKILFEIELFNQLLINENKIWRHKPIIILILYIHIIRIYHLLLFEKIWVFFEVSLFF